MSRFFSINIEYLDYVQDPVDYVSYNNQSSALLFTAAIAQISSSQDMP